MNGKGFLIKTFDIFSKHDYGQEITSGDLTFGKQSDLQALYPGCIQYGK